MVRIGSLARHGEERRMKLRRATGKNRVSFVRQDIWSAVSSNWLLESSICIEKIYILMLRTDSFHQKLMQIPLWDFSQLLH
jgi:hypothetical protein